MKTFGRQFWAGLAVGMGFWLILLSVVEIPEYTVIVEHECRKTLL